MSKSSKGPSVHVAPVRSSGGTRFTVKEAGKPQPLMRPTTQERAIERARPVVREYQSELVIHRRNGQIRDSDSQGHDPNPPRDTK